MKKLLALLLALLTVASFAACSDEGDEEENLDYFKQEDVVYTSLTNEYGTFHFDTLDSDSVVITGYEGGTDLHAVVIPSTVKTGDDEATVKTVAAIGKSAFKAVSAITSVTIPEGVVEIGDYAFADCVQMATVTLPSTIQTIGQGAFRNSGITTLVFPETCGLTEIKLAAFASCTKLTELTIPAYITTIRQGAFQNCTALAKIVISEGVTTIEKQAFQGTNALAQLVLPSTFTNTDPMDDLVFSGSDVLYRENITCPAGSAAEAYADKMILATAPDAE